MTITINFSYIAIYMIGYFLCLLIMTQFEKDYQRKSGKRQDDGARWMFSILWPIFIPVFGILLLFEHVVIPFLDWFDISNNINSDEEIKKCKDFLAENNINIS